MEEELRLLFISFCSQSEQLRFRATSRASAATLQSLLETLVLDAGPLPLLRRRGAADDVNSSDRWKAVRSFLSHHTKIRSISLRGAKVSVDELSNLFAAAPNIAEVDVTFALPLAWPEFSVFRSHCAFRVYDTLEAEPEARHTPREVVVAQAYGLHSRRIDVCYRFASPANKAQTGPLIRFAQFFEAPGRFSSMLGCKSFRIDSEQLHGRALGDGDKPSRAIFQLTFVTTTGAEFFFAWELSLQIGNQYNGCWMTDGVVPMDIEAMWDGSMAEEWEPPIYD